MAGLRCAMHNSNEFFLRKHIMLLPNGNQIPLCSACCEWWKKSALESDDPTIQPVSIRDIP